MADLDVDRVLPSFPALNTGSISSTFHTKASISRDTKEYRLSRVPHESLWIRAPRS